MSTRIAAKPTQASSLLGHKACRGFFLVQQTVLVGLFITTGAEKGGKPGPEDQDQSHSVSDYVILKGLVCFSYFSAIWALWFSAMEVPGDHFALSWLLFSAIFHCSGIISLL